MTKLNCWEFMKCGREVGGKNVEQLGVCLAATEIKASGIHSGINGGGCCWAIAGTLCGGEIQGTFAMKLGSCIKCEFHKLVINEEMDKFVQIGEVFLKLKK